MKIMTGVEYKAARERLGTQAEIAARLGVACSTVAHREGGGMPITTEAALAILALPKRKRGGRKMCKYGCRRVAIWQGMCGPCLDLHW